MNVIYMYMAAGIPWRSVFSSVLHMPCLFHLLTGWYCPGCGGTRAVKYLLQGKLYLSFQYHPIVLYTAAAVIIKLTEAGAVRVLKKSGGVPKLGSLLLYGAVAVVAVNWVIKNYLLIACGIDLLKAPLWPL